MGKVIPVKRFCITMWLSKVDCQELSKLFRKLSKKEQGKRHSLYFCLAEEFKKKENQVSKK